VGADTVLSINATKTSFVILKGVDAVNLNIDDMQASGGVVI